MLDEVFGDLWLKRAGEVGVGHGVREQWRLLLELVSQPIHRRLVGPTRDVQPSASLKRSQRSREVLPRSAVDFTR